MAAPQGHRLRSGCRSACRGCAPEPPSPCVLDKLLMLSSAQIVDQRLLGISNPLHVGWRRALRSGGAGPAGSLLNAWLTATMLICGTAAHDLHYRLPKSTGACHACFACCRRVCCRRFSGRHNAASTAATPQPSAAAVPAATRGPCRRLPAGISHRTGSDAAAAPASSAGCTAAAIHPAWLPSPAGHRASTSGGGSSATTAADCRLPSQLSTPSGAACCCCCCGFWGCG